MGKEVPMPWRETCAMEERMRFILDYERGEYSMTALCRCYGVSRKTGTEFATEFRDTILNSVELSMVSRNSP